MRPCKHACPELCHFGPCTQCELPIRFDCYCERIRKYISCWQTFDKELLAKLKSCGTKCGRPLEFCNHLCDLPCHPPKCPSEGCTKKVTLKCKCNTIKKNVTCDLARAELKRLHISQFKTQILPCNPELCLSKPEPNPKTLENNTESPTKLSDSFPKRKPKNPPPPQQSLEVSLINKPPKHKSNKPWSCRNLNHWVASLVVVGFLCFILWAVLSDDKNIGRKF